MSLRACILTSVHTAFDVRILHKECKSLARAGFNVTMIAPHAEDLELDGVRLRAVPRPVGRLDRITRTVWRVYREAIRQRADVYHFHDPELIPVGLLLRLRGKKVIYDVHEDLPRCMPYKPYLPKWLGRFSAKLVEAAENMAARCFSAVIPATPGIAMRFERLNRRTVTVNNYPMLQEWIAPAPQPTWTQREPAIAFVSAGITRTRGAQEMVEAMSLLPCDLAATLEFVGEIQPPELKDVLSKLSGWSRVRLHGTMDRRGVSGLLHRVRAGIVVEHPVPNYLNGKPTKLFEYMAAGLPVIASDFPECRKIIEGAGCGLLVDPLNPKQIAAAIEHILLHPQQAEEMGMRGLGAIQEQYNWGVEEKKLIGLYSALAEA
ncbi:MAG TPA: glycosyltransferase family 4 protein [Candidatus Acidoferrales bacterium]|nr:glycosyltransferase family 4 protein [Candidatus Acidoferrales bacterium]